MPPHVIFSPLYPLPSYFIIHLTPFYIAPLRHRLLRIVLRCLEYCSRAGLLHATTLSRFWNSAATTAWLGLALAAFCAFYAVFASPSQDKLSELDSEVGAVSRFTTFHLREWNCSRVFLALLLLRKLGFSMKPFLLLWPLNT